MADLTSKRDTRHCPECGAPLTVEVYDDGQLYGILYLDIRYGCLVCGFEEWDSEEREVRDGPRTDE